MFDMFFPRNVLLVSPSVVSSSFFPGEGCVTHSHAVNHDMGGCVVVLLM